MQVDEDYICIQSGIDFRQLEIVKKQLEELGVIYFYENWVIFSDDSYVSPATGKLSKAIHEKDLLLVPDVVKDYYDNRGQKLQSHTRAALVYKDKDNNKDINKGKDKAIDKRAEDCAQLLGMLVQQNYDWIKPTESTIKKWSEDIEKINRLDGFDYELIAETIKWVQADSFWRKNIQSGSKLRDKFNRLLVEVKSERVKSPRKVAKI